MSGKSALRTGTRHAYLRLLDSSGRREGITTVYPLTDSLLSTARAHSGRTTGSVEVVEAIRREDGRWHPGHVVARYKNGSRKMEVVS